MTGDLNGQKPHDWRKRLYEIIFEANTFGGWLFDVILIVAILLSVLAVILESVPSISALFGRELVIIEWFFTILFSIEYFFRVISLRKPLKYITSFYGIVDLLSFLPMYIGILLGGLHIFLVVRVLRLLRLFRIFKMAYYLQQAAVLSLAMRRSRPKITVFLLLVAVVTIIMGALIYVIEGSANGFASIPQGIYWAVVTLTSVGYGDIVPHTALGKFFASLLMILGYAIIAVPTGIISVEIAKSSMSTNNESCPSCGKEGHADDAKFCKHCGALL